MDAFNRRELHILLGTSRSVEPASITAFDVLIIASPVRYVAGLAQLIGKLSIGSKLGLIYDYLDRVEMLKTSLKKRKKVFKALGAVEDN